MNSKSNAQAMETEKISRLLARLAIPAVVAQIINLLYNIVDRIYIGHIPGVGAAALTGVGLFTPILMLINAFAMLAGSGGAPRAAISMGKKDNKTAEKILAQLNGGNVTDKPEILFQRLDLEEVIKKVEELHPPVEEEKEEEGIDIEAKEEITFDDFMKMQFQVGEIIACEEVKKSKKLLCSQVKIGSQVKQIVSGIKGHYTAEEMVGKKVMVLVNLKPAKLAGVLSEGMLLCAEDAEGNLALMTPEKTMPAGAEIC